ncbi:MAG TPA: MFS transporter [Candidatus Limnocylindria bacterium]|nr:MFS transporter [Candidatus Limnocylindria bacterium]
MTASTSPRPRPTYKWWVVFMLWFVCFFNYADRQSIAAVFPELEREFHFSKEQLGLIASAFMWVYAGGSLFAGLICDRFRRKDLILGGCLFWSFVTITTGWCSKLWQFVSVRAMEGLGETFYFPASMSLTSDYHSGASRSRAIAFHQSSVYAGTILGSWGGAWLAMHYGWRTGFYFFGLAGMVLALVLFFFLREPARGEAEISVNDQVAVPQEPLGIFATFQAIFRSPSILLLMLAFVGANSVAAVFMVWTPSFLKDKFHYNLAMAGLSGTVFINLASAVSVPFAGWLADRLSQKMAAGRILVQAIGLVGGASFVFWVGHTSNHLTLIVSMTLFGLCKGFYDSGIFASLYDSVEPRARGTVVGIMNTVGWGGGAFGPWFVGWIADHGSQPTKIDNMSQAISWGGLIYILAATLLLAAAYIRWKNANRAKQWT